MDSQPRGQGQHHQAAADDLQTTPANSVAGAASTYDFAADLKLLSESLASPIAAAPAPTTHTAAHQTH